MKKILKSLPWLIVSLLIPLMIGFISGRCNIFGIEHWYAFLEKPWFVPPAASFGMVWTTLYLLMGFSSYIILLAPSSTKKNVAMTIYVFQLLFNFIWSFVFFRYHLLATSVWISGVLWILALAMIILFYRINKLAAYFQIPLLLWLSFALFLNYFIWKLNG